MADAISSLPSDLYDQGDPAFVDALREVHDADVLAAFAEVWFNDQRPDSRRLLFEYLDRPLNAYRHEGLIKRLFKKAEAAGDDELMARFLVLFDRSVRRIRKRLSQWKYQGARTQAEADDLVAIWNSLGYENVSSWGQGKEFYVHGRQRHEVIRQPKNTAMPRGTQVEVWIGWPSKKRTVPDWAIALKLDYFDPVKQFTIQDLPNILDKLKKFRLFSLVTRNYLRRRAWRYFRKLGKTQPERYVAAVSQALALYRDEDGADELALIDNWGLIHILFHNSPALEAKPTGWKIKAGHSLSELSPTPIYENLWDQSPGQVVGLLSTARSSTVRRWAIRRVEADPTTHRSGLPLEGWLELLRNDDPEIVALAATMLEGMDGLEGVTVDRWLSLAGSTDAAGLDVLCRLIDRHVKPDQVTLEQAVKLAGSRPLPVAKLGFTWLQTKSVREPSEILGLIDAGCSILRPEILAWLRSTLSHSLTFEPASILEFLDARQLDARTEGWNWFRSEPRAFDDVSLWRKLLESPHDDIRLALVAELESRAKLPFDMPDLRPLWASVLLNIHRGSRAKPVVVRQLLDRMNANPAIAGLLLPLLSIALRSVRGPERRAALVALVQLVEKRAKVEPLVRETFPELQWAEEFAR